jgi:hypothetical protein
MSDEKSIWQMSKRELFERVQELDESLKGIYRNIDTFEDEDEFVNVRALIIREYNDHYVLLFRRMFRKHKIFRVNPNW